MHGATSQNAHIEINDPLYYIQDVLDIHQKNTWMDIGLRPLPVPTDWRSEDGNDFVLRFKNHDIQSFHMVWQSKKQKAPFPSGTKEIGPKGGSVELPGVGKIELPEGALTETITVKLSQQMKAYSILETDNPGGDAVYYDFASPVLKVEPLLLELKKEGNVYLNLDEERLGNNSSDIVRALGAIDLTQPNNLQYMIGSGAGARYSHLESGATTQVNLDKSSFPIVQFLYYTFTISPGYSPTKGVPDGYPPFKIKNTNSP